LVLKEKAIGQKYVTGPAAPSPGLPAALALPLLAVAVYLVLYMSDLWRLGGVLLAPRVVYAGPVPYLAFAAIIGFGMSWYAAARPPAVLAGAAVLFVLLSLISIGQSAATQEFLALVPRDVLSLALTAVALPASVLYSAAVMLVAGAIVPALRKESYWLIALILWPLAGYLIFSTLPVVAATWRLDPSSIPHLSFAATLVRQCIIFGCIGYWLDDNASGSPQSLGKTAPHPPA
jgi:hypothetical protein